MERLKKKLYVRWWLRVRLQHKENIMSKLKAVLSWINKNIGLVAGIAAAAIVAIVFKENLGWAITLMIVSFSGGVYMVYKNPKYFGLVKKV